jgi:hypothetical protein
MNLRTVSGLLALLLRGKVSRAEERLAPACSTPEAIVSETAADGGR